MLFRSNFFLGRDIVSLEAVQTPRAVFEEFASRPKPPAAAPAAAPAEATKVTRAPRKAPAKKPEVAAAESGTETVAAP